MRRYPRLIGISGIVTPQTLALDFLFVPSFAEFLAQVGAFGLVLEFLNRALLPPIQYANCNPSLGVKCRHKYDRQCTRFRRLVNADAG